MTEEEQRLVQSSEVLCKRVAHFCHGRLIDNVTIITVETIIADHTAHSRMNGLKFPDMTMVILPVQGWIQIVRKDASGSDIQQLIRNLIAKFPRMEATELAPAIRRAFPSYKVQLEGVSNG